MAATVGHPHAVWVLLIERGVDEGAELSLYWREPAASAAARRYLEQAWPAEDPLPADVPEAIERYNQLPGVAEHVLVSRFSIEGQQFFDGEEDLRPRCTVCGEPLVLADPADSESWIHSDDARDQADHTAEVGSVVRQSMEGNIA